jgi:hypothetical protein
MTGSHEVVGSIPTRSTNLPLNSFVGLYAINGAPESRNTEAPRFADSGVCPSSHNPAHAAVPDPQGVRWRRLFEIKYDKRRIGNDVHAAQRTYRSIKIWSEQRRNASD